MADKTVTVNPGGGADYTSLNAAFSGEDGAAFDAFTGILYINCSGSTADTTAADTGTGFASPSTTHYIQITGDNTTGKASTTKYRISLTSAASNTAGIYLNSAYARVKNVEIATVTGPSYRAFTGIKWDNTSAYCVCEACIIHDIYDSGYQDYGHGVYFLRNGTVRNCIIYNVSGAGIFENGGYGTGVFVQNNTVYNYRLKSGGVYGGIKISNDTTNSANKLQNNLVIAGANGGDCYTFNSGITDSNNGSSDTTGDIDNLTAADLFVSVTAGSEDLHLKAGADAIDVGADLSATFTTDIDGVTRSGTWDIGADEYVVAVTHLSISVADCCGNITQLGG